MSTPPEIALAFANYMIGKSKELPDLAGQTPSGRDMFLAWAEDAGFTDDMWSQLLFRLAVFDQAVSLREGSAGR